LDWHGREELCSEFYENAARNDTGHSIQEGALEVGIAVKFGILIQQISDGNKHFQLRLVEDSDRQSLLHFNIER
jgi:hypothetical protein